MSYDRTQKPARSRLVGRDKKGHQDDYSKVSKWTDIGDEADEVSLSDSLTLARDSPRLLLPDRTQEEVAYWWFMPPSSSSQDTTFSNIKSRLYDLRNEGMFREGIATYAIQKQAYLTGETTNYLKQQDHLLQIVKQATNDTSSASSIHALVALTVLAYCALQDGRYDFVRHHLLAVNSLGQNFYQSHQIGYEWVYIVWIDLAHSLVTDTAPMLRFFIPTAWRNESWSLSQVEIDSARTAAANASRLCPTLPSFTDQDCLGVFGRLYILEATMTQQRPLIGRYYEAIHKLATLQDRVRQASTPSSLTIEHYITFFLIACQLQFRSIGRYWLPQGLGIRQKLLRSVCQRIRKTSSTTMLQTWTTQADASSLLWSMTTISACALECGLDASEAPLHAIRTCLHALGITTLGHFLSTLNEWPSDHTGKLRAVYTRAKSPFNNLSVPSGPLPTASSQVPIEFAL